MNQLRNHPKTMKMKKNIENWLSASVEVSGDSLIVRGDRPRAGEVEGMEEGGEWGREMVSLWVEIYVNIIGFVVNFIWLCFEFISRSEHCTQTD